MKLLIFRCPDLRTLYIEVESMRHLMEDLGRHVGYTSPLMFRLDRPQDQLEQSAPSLRVVVLCTFCNRPDSLDEDVVVVNDTTESWGMSLRQYYSSIKIHHSTAVTTIIIHGPPAALESARHRVPLSEKTDRSLLSYISA